MTIDDDKGNTVFHILTRAECFECLEKLFSDDTNRTLAQDSEFNERLKRKNEAGNTFLHLAVLHSILEKLITTLEKYEDWKAVAEETNQDGFNVLHLAVLNKDMDMVEQILKSFVGKIDIDIGTSDGETALHLAAKMGSTDMIERLVKLGADLAAQDNDGHTFLHDCLQQVHLEGGSVHLGRCRKFKEVWRCVVDLSSECTMEMWESKKTKIRKLQEKNSVSAETLPEQVQKRRDVLFLLRSELFNHSGLSVLQYAADLGLEECVLVMLTEKGVFVVNDDQKKLSEDNYMIEVTNLTPELQIERISEAEDNATGFRRKATLVETLVKVKPSMKASKILDSTPLRKLLQWQWNVYQSFSIFWLVMHTIIMLFFSINAQGVFHSGKASESLAVRKSTMILDGFLLGYSSVLCLLRVISAVWKLYIRGAEQTIRKQEQKKRQKLKRLLPTKDKMKVEDKTKKLYKGDKGIFGYLTRAVNGLVSNAGFVLSITFFTFCLLAVVVSSNQQYVVVKGFSLLFGWLIILVPARIYGPTFHVISTLKLLVINDMIPFLFFYLIITLAFACAVQVQFQLFHFGYIDADSHDIVHHLQTLGTVFFELLVLTVGLDTDLKHIQGVTNSFGESPLNVTVMQVLLTTYCVLSALILLNMLIAMMGTTMNTVTQDEGLIWRQHQVSASGFFCHELTVITKGACERRNGLFDAIILHLESFLQPLLMLFCRLIKRWPSDERLSPFNICSGNASPAAADDDAAPTHRYRRRISRKNRRRKQCRPVSSTSASSWTKLSSKCLEGS